METIYIKSGNINLPNIHTMNNIPSNQQIQPPRQQHPSNISPNFVPSHQMNTMNNNTLETNHIQPLNTIPPTHQLPLPPQCQHQQQQQPSCLQPLLPHQLHNVGQRYQQQPYQQPHQQSMQYQPLLQGPPVYYNDQMQVPQYQPYYMMVSPNNQGLNDQATNNMNSQPPIYYTQQQGPMQNYPPVYNNNPNNSMYPNQQFNYQIKPLEYPPQQNQQYFQQPRSNPPPPPTTITGMTVTGQASHMNPYLQHQNINPPQRPFNLRPIHTQSQPHINFESNNGNATNPPSQLATPVTSSYDPECSPKSMISSSQTPVNTLANLPGEDASQTSRIGHDNFNNTSLPLPPPQHVLATTTTAITDEATPAVNHHVAIATSKNKSGSGKFEGIKWVTKKTSKSWTKKEDNLLLLLKDIDKLNWCQIASHFPDRSTNGCQFRWRRLINKTKNETNHDKEATEDVKDETSEQEKKEDDTEVKKENKDTTTKENTVTMIENKETTVDSENKDKSVKAENKDESIQ